MGRIGNYRVGKKIGEGGFGKVYVAEHVLLGDRGKACLKQNKYAEREHAELLIYEAALLWDLDKHHSIPGIKDVFRPDDLTAVIAMDFIDGPTLDEIVKEKGRLHPEDACWITERLLGALRFVHAYGIIHSDVKPQNVFVEEKKSDIKLIDFGLATYKPKHGTKPMGFTPGYAAPEIVNGNTPIPESDIYGAGMVLLTALGGDVSTKALPKDVPRELSDYCDSLLKYDPIERPSWMKNDPAVALSDIRQKVFGRRHRHH